jgi:cellular nucleic acid-binding protein
MCNLCVLCMLSRGLTCHQGHISRDCTAPNGGPLSSAGKVCYKCSQAGHISRDCPTNDATQSAESGVLAAAPVATTGVVEVSEGVPVAAAPTTAVA